MNPQQLLRRAARLPAVLTVLVACSSEPRVPAAIELNPPTLEFTALGQTQQLTPAVRDQRGDALDHIPVTWDSRDAAVATVSSTGLVTAQGGGSTVITASAGSAIAEAGVTVSQTPTQLSKVSGDGQTGTAGEMLASPLIVEVRDALGSPIAGTTVVFAVMQGGGSLGSTSVATATDGRASTSFTTGPTAGGPQTVSASIAASSISVLFTATTVAGPATSIGMAAGNNQRAAAGSAVPVRPAVLVRDTNANPVVGVAVEFEVVSGGGSLTGGSRVTGANGRAEVGGWTLGPDDPNVLRATAAGAGISGNPVTFVASTASTPFNIEVRFVTGATSGQAEAFTRAEQKWEALVVGDLTDIPISQPAGSCDDGTPAIDETIDDIVIFAMIEPIDGAGGILGQAGPCFLRTQGLLPLVGVMFFDSEDMGFIEGAGLLDGLIVHEMGHVLGFGTLWPSQNLLAGAASSGGLDPHFTGSQAALAFDSAGGFAYEGTKVPVENIGSPGTVDSHWRESVFATELMTGFINMGANPLSGISVAALADQGYSVDLSQADPFTFTSLLRLPGGGRRVSLMDDVRRLPLRTFDRNGRLTGVLRP